MHVEAELSNFPGTLYNASNHVGGQWSATLRDEHEWHVLSL